jgi:multidrug resistance protein
MSPRPDAFLRSMASTIFAPGVPQALSYFQSDDATEGSLLISIYLIGLAVGPLFLSPLSELYGRSIVFHVANVVFLIASTLCAVSVSLPMLIVFRLVMGLACVIPITLGGGYVADLMPAENRGMALTLWTIGPLLGPVIGPVAGGYLTMGVGWRWTFWLVVILSGISTIASVFLLRETYAPVLLKWKAEKLKKETGNVHLRSKFDKGQTASELFRLAIVRPAKMICFSPIVALLSVFVAIVYSYMYLLFTTFPDVFQENYKFNTGAAGLAYIGLGIGFVIGQVFVGLFTDRYLARQKSKHGVSKPEDRLPPLVIGSFLFPIGLFWYGWSAQYRVHWIVPIIGTSFCGIGILGIFLPIQMYLIDVFTLYAASAIAANTVIRSVFGTVIPLAGPALYARLGLGWGNSLLAFLGLAFAPFTILFLVYGEKIRTNPRFIPKL